MPGSLVRQLHVIGFTSDHAGLILAGRQGAKTGSFVLQIDDTLLDHLDRARSIGAVDGADVENHLAPAPPAVDGVAALTEAPRTPRTSVQSGLSPREIQARLRAGRTVEEVAAEAGVGTDWVDRFAAPVLAEQAAAVARAGDSTLHTARKGQSDRPLEASVLRNLADRNVMMTAAEFASGWSALHLIDHDWLVRFRFRSRGRAMVAEWTYDTGSGTLTSRNRLGLELGFVDPGRPAAVLADIEGSADPPLSGARKAPATSGRRAGTSRPSAIKATATGGRVTPRSDPAAKKRSAAKRVATATGGPAVTKRPLPAGGTAATAAKRAGKPAVTTTGAPAPRLLPVGAERAGRPSAPVRSVSGEGDRTAEIRAAVDRPGPPG